MGRVVAEAADEVAAKGERADERVLWRTLGRYPRLAVVGGALCLSTSGILVRLAGVSPSTAATYRAVYALPFLAIVAWAEDRELGPRSWRIRRWAFLAGLFFAADLTFFHHAIELMGAGLATVFGNLQVIFVGAIAWLVLGERLTGRLLAGVPIALLGVILIAGVVGGGAYGNDPGLGAVVGLLTAASYAGYLLVLRRGQESLRVAGPIFDATLSCAIASAVGGILVGDLQPIPTWPSAFWLFLLAVSAQFGEGCSSGSRCRGSPR